MDKLFVDKTIEIDAPSSKVWDVITKREFTDQWTSEFSPGMHLESDWKKNSSAVWKIEDKVVVEGEVTKVEPLNLLRFTVFDVKKGRFPVSEEDGITFELKEEKGKTKLHVLHGDFSVLEEGKKYYNMTLPVWDVIMPKLKMLAEKLS